MRPSLHDLITRMSDQTPTASSDQSISWHAHREAERLTDRSMVDELDAFVQTERDRHRRDAAYFAIGKIGMNFRDSSCAEILIHALARERDKYVLSHMLERIGDIPKSAEVDLTPVFSLLDDKRWQVRLSALNALCNCNSAAAEDRLLTHLASATHEGDIVNCNAALNNMGTPRAIPIIAANLNSRIRDVRDSARFAIEAIQARFPEQR